MSEAVRTEIPCQGARRDRAPGRAAAGRGPATEAAELNRDLQRDPGPAEAEYDGDNHYAYCERMACQFFECCQRLRELGGLVRARDELLGILERLDTEDMTEEATRLSTATTNLFAEIYRELVEDEPSAAAGGE
jgi:hypothetical protein